MGALLILGVPIWMVLLMHVIFFVFMISQPVLVHAKVQKGIRLTNYSLRIINHCAAELEAGVVVGCTSELIAAAWLKTTPRRSVICQAYRSAVHDPVLKWPIRLLMIEVASCTCSCVSGTGRTIGILLVGSQNADPVAWTSSLGWVLGALIASPPVRGGGAIMPILVSTTTRSASEG